MVAAGALDRSVGGFGGTTHQDGLQVIYEPLAFYSAFADEEILWLAESYSFNDDFTELTIKTRSGINWSDGEPFSAEDVAYTIDTLRQLGAEVMWGTEMATFVEKAEATDANTCGIPTSGGDDDDDDDDDDSGKKDRQRRKLSKSKSVRTDLHDKHCLPVRLEIAA